VGATSLSRQQHELYEGSAHTNSETVLPADGWRIVLECIESPQAIRCDFLITVLE
jgi:hypothetical protein